MKPKQLKIIGLIVLAIMLLNLVLAAFRVINWTIFWVVIVLGALFAYQILPKLKQ